MLLFLPYFAQQFVKPQNKFIKWHRFGQFGVFSCHRILCSSICIYALNCSVLCSNRQNCLRFDVTLVLLKIQFFWDAKPCQRNCYTITSKMPWILAEILCLVVSVCLHFDRPCQINYEDCFWRIDVGSVLGYDNCSCTLCVGYCYQGIFVIHNVSEFYYYTDIFWTEPKFCLLSSMCRKQLIFSY